MSGKWTRNRWVRIAAAAIVLIVAVLLLRAPILTAIGRFLIVSDPPARSDFIFMMAGQPRVRPVHAAAVYRDGWAPRVVLASTEPTPAELLGFEESEANYSSRLLQWLGVPAKAIVILEVPGGATSTMDEARLIRTYARRHAFRSAIVVTSEFHTRRTRWAIRRQPGSDSLTIRMSFADDPRYDPENWWRSELGLLACAAEFLKFVHNFFN